LTADRARVGFTDPTGTATTISAPYVAGCDGARGPSRASLPAGAVTLYEFDHGVSWLTLLATSPPPRRPMMAVSDSGFAAQFYRTPTVSRFYLQCEPGDALSDWPADRVWAQLRARFGDDDLVDGPIIEIVHVDMRSSV